MSTAEEGLHGAPRNRRRSANGAANRFASRRIKCPHCRKWRKDIQEDINKNLQWAVCAIGCAVSLPQFSLASELQTLGAKQLL